MIRSLSMRLMGLALVWLVLAVILAGITLLFLFKANVERTMRADLDAASSRLVAVILPEATAPAISQPLPNPLYSTPFSGYYWQIDEPGSAQATRSRSLWDTVLAVPEGGDELFTTMAGPQGQSLATLSRRVEFPSSRGPRRYRVTVAQDRAILDQSIAKFQTEMTVALALLGLALLAAAWVQIRLGLAPIANLHSAVEQIRQGRKDRLEGPYPSELTPLITEVNELLAAREKSAEYARSRAADLAHGLKTPLSVLASTADRLRDKGDERTADELQQLCSEMSDRIDYQLRLASLRLRAGTHVANASLHAAVIRTLGVLRKTSLGEHIAWMIELGPDTVIDMDRQDLLELIGVVLENASKWADSCVTVATRRVGALAEVEIGDDGPGLSAEQIASIGGRGRRMDESRPGTGFGLAIALEILALNGGEAVFGKSEKGGLQVLLRLRTGAGEQVDQLST